MHKLALLPSFDQRGRLLGAALHYTATGHSSYLPCYAPGTGLTLYQIEKHLHKLRQLLELAEQRGDSIITSDFKQLVEVLELPLRSDPYPVYDMQLVVPQGSSQQTLLLVAKQMTQIATQPYQSTVANAAIVYRSWEKRGLLCGGLPLPINWSQQTATGRSRVHGYNIQGIPKSERAHISNPMGSDNDVLLLFDWISADIRMAAHFSQDQQLIESFRHSDPYTYLMQQLGLAEADPSELPQIRAECKVALLRSINSMDLDSPVFTVYRELGRWIAQNHRKLNSADGYLTTLLGRKFLIRNKQSKLQVLNGQMQGSVAEAMQLAIRRIWEVVGHRLLAEVHDSLVISCDGRPAAVRATIEQVRDILLYPFRELAQQGMCADIDLPFRVCVGRVWHGWRELETYRAEAKIYDRASTDPMLTEPDRAAINSWFAPASTNYCTDESTVL